MGLFRRNKSVPSGLSVGRCSKKQDVNYVSLRVLYHGSDMDEVNRYQVGSVASSLPAKNQNVSVSVYKGSDSENDPGFIDYTIEFDGELGKRKLKKVLKREFKDVFKIVNSGKLRYNYDKEVKSLKTQHLKKEKHLRQNGHYISEFQRTNSESIHKPSVNSVVGTAALGLLQIYATIPFFDYAMATGAQNTGAYFMLSVGGFGSSIACMLMSAYDLMKIVDKDSDEENDNEPHEVLHLKPQTQKSN
jgi:hypothetical protein